MHDFKLSATMEPEADATISVNQQPKTKPDRFDMTCLVLATLNLIAVLIISNGKQFLGLIDIDTLLISLLCFLPINISALLLHRRAVRRVFNQYFWFWVSLFLAIVLDMVIPRFVIFVLVLVSAIGRFYVPPLLFLV